MSTIQSSTISFCFINDFPTYGVASNGVVWSFRNGTWNQLKPTIDRDGYGCVDLYKNGKVHDRQVHRLVLETFIGPCPDGMVCRHLDGNPRNNNLGNLAWGTHAENKADSIKHGTSARQFGENNGCAKLTKELVLAIREEYLNKLSSQQQLADKYKMSRASIGLIINRKRWKHI